MARLGRGQPNRPVVTRAPADTPAGSGSLTVAFTLTGSGAKHAAGSGTLSLALTPAGTGAKHATGTGALTVDFALSGAGTKQTGIGLPARPRSRWQLVVGPASGGHELALTQATGRRYVARLVDNSELAFTINGRHTQAAAINSLTTDVHLLWTDSGGGTQILDRLRVGNTSDSINADGHRTQVTCLDYRAVLARRPLLASDTLTYTATDQAEIAWRLIQSTQAHPGGDLGIHKGWTGTSPTGIPRDVTYTAGDLVGDRIAELGFHWDITPTSSSALRLDVWYPERGVDRGVVLIHGGKLVASVDRQENVADYANAIRYSGADGLTARELEASDLASRPEGRWGRTFGDTTLNTQSMLDARATWQLEQSQVISPPWTVKLRRGAWEGPQHIWVGDPVRLVVRSGRVDVNEVLQVYEVAIDLDGDGGETVTLSLGAPAPDYRRRDRAVDRRIRNLERR